MTIGYLFLEFIMNHVEEVIQLTKQKVGKANMWQTRTSSMRTESRNFEKQFSFIVRFGIDKNRSRKFFFY